MTGGERGGGHHLLNFQFWGPHVDGGVKFFQEGGYRHTLNFWASITMSWTLKGFFDEFIFRFMIAHINIAVFKHTIDSCWSNHPDSKVDERVQLLTYFVYQVPSSNQKARFRDFFIASMQCVSDLKKEFVVVLVILDAELLSKFPQNWIVSRLVKITQYRSFIPDYSWLN